MKVVPLRHVTRIRAILEPVIVMTRDRNAFAALEAHSRVRMCPQAEAHALQHSPKQARSHVWRSARTQHPRQIALDQRNAFENEPNRLNPLFLTPHVILNVALIMAFSRVNFAAHVAYKKYFTIFGFGSVESRVVMTEQLREKLHVFETPKILIKGRWIVPSLAQIHRPTRRGHTVQKKNSPESQFQLSIVYVFCTRSSPYVSVFAPPRP
jgi:hypothetical protein